MKRVSCSGWPPRPITNVFSAVAFRRRSGRSALYVEHADWVLAGDPETAFDAGRRREERPWTTAPPLPVHEELNLAFEHVERVCVIVVDVGINTLPARFKNSLDDLEVGEFSEQPVRSVLRLKPLAFVRGCEERSHHADHADVVTHAQSRPHAGRGGLR